MVVADLLLLLGGALSGGVLAGGSFGGGPGELDEGGEGHGHIVRHVHQSNLGDS